LRRHGLLVKLLIVCTILWAGLYGKALWDSSGLVYSPDMPRTALNLAIVTGLPLSAAWAVAAVKRGNILLACAATGTMLALCFFFAANTENLGYTIEYVPYIWHSRGYVVRLNPFLHLGGGTLVGYIAMDTAFQNSMSIPNQLLYLAYGELISLAVAGLGLLTRKLAHHFRFIPAQQ
jgi:uncharacterized membrane protein YjfL (UPF0719 family)